VPGKYWAKIHLLEAIPESECNVPHFNSQDILSLLIKKDVTDVSEAKLGRLYN